MQMKTLFELVKHDWNDIQHNENELDVLQSRTSTGKLITIVATSKFILRMENCQNLKHLKISNLFASIVIYPRSFVI